MLVKMVRIVAFVVACTLILLDYLLIKFAVDVFLTPIGQLTLLAVFLGIVSVFAIFLVSFLVLIASLVAILGEDL